LAIPLIGEDISRWKITVEIVLACTCALRFERVTGCPAVTGGLGGDAKSVRTQGGGYGSSPSLGLLVYGGRSLCLRSTISLPQAANTTAAATRMHALALG
jgi:hypothetical protein